MRGKPRRMRLESRLLRDDYGFPPNVMTTSGEWVVCFVDSVAKFLQVAA